MLTLTRVKNNAMCDAKSRLPLAVIFLDANVMRQMANPEKAATDSLLGFSPLYKGRVAGSARLDARRATRKYLGGPRFNNPIGHEIYV